MSKNAVLINVERLTEGLIIHHTGLDFGPLGSFAMVDSIEFNGESYCIKARFLDEDGNVSRHAVEFIADAGDTITYGGRNEPKLRPEADVSFEEWQAKAAAIGAAHERLMLAAVAEALSNFTEPTHTQNEAAA